jgi:hypothetical protein
LTITTDNTGDMMNYSTSEDKEWLLATYNKNDYNRPPSIWLVK